MQAFQDLYPEDLSHCYGCGRNNPHGHQLKSYWDDDETIALFTPKSFHTAIPGFVYGGLIALAAEAANIIYTCKCAQSVIIILYLLINMNPKLPKSSI